MSRDAAREADTFPGRWTAAIACALILFVWICAGVLWLIYPAVRDPSPPRPAAFAAPGLEVAPVEDYDAYMAHQRALLAGAGGRKPIEDAMAEVARRGTLAPAGTP